jgi:predicted ferric reductase
MGLWSRQVMPWTLAYLLLASLPIAVAIAPPRPPLRPLIIELGVGLGFAAFGVFALQFALIGRFRRIAPHLGTDTIMLFHRRMGIAGYLLFVGHVVVVLVSNPAFLEFLDPTAAIDRAGALWAVLIGASALVLVSVFKRSLPISYEAWRVSHSALAAAVILIGLAHGLRVGHHLGSDWKQGAWMAIGTAPLLTLAYVRFVRSWLVARRPYRVVEVRREAGPAWTLVLQPEGHPGLPFKSGQFAWASIGHSPFAFREHPFSLSSSAENPHHLELTIKELGDFTSSIGQTPTGTRVFLDGPYGAFVPPDTAPLVFVAGGVGITPVMSMLRTFSDRDEVRPLVLLYSSAQWPTMLFARELLALADRLELKFVPVLLDPSSAPFAERGPLNAEILDRHIPASQLEGAHFFICGPPALMDLAEAYLRERHVPTERIHSERFDLL